MIRREQDGIVWYEFAHLATHPELRHGVFTRLGGASEGQWASLNISLAVGDDEVRVKENRRRLAEALGFAPSRVAVAGQVHGASVSVVSSHTLPPEGGARIAETDGLVAADPGLGLLMTFADCVPLVLYDPRRKVIGLAHAGWRGTVAGVGPATVQKMAHEFSSRPQEVLVGIGPSIGPCCYEVGDDVVAAARQALGDTEAVAARNAAGRWQLDLWEANRRLLVQAGVAPERIGVAELCTACHTDEFFSHRGERGRSGRFGALVGLRAD